MTCAPALRATSAVESLEPSSTTMTSRHGAHARRRRTRSLMVAASSRAGMTIDTEAGSANELLDHSVPRDLESSRPAALSKLSRTISIAGELRDRKPDRFWFRNTDESVFAVPHEL